MHYYFPYFLKTKGYLIEPGVYCIGLVLVGSFLFERRLSLAWKTIRNYKLINLRRKRWLAAKTVERFPLGCRVCYRSHRESVWLKRITQRACPCRRSVRFSIFPFTSALSIYRLSHCGLMDCVWTFFNDYQTNTASWEKGRCNVSFTTSADKLISKANSKASVCQANFYLRRDRIVAVRSEGVWAGVDR